MMQIEGVGLQDLQKKQHRPGSHKVPPGADIKKWDNTAAPPIFLKITRSLRCTRHRDNEGLRHTGAKATPAAGACDTSAETQV